ncbi:MAG: DNA internalization-related competence protein ComEC/Rec2 [Pseudomonas sp.]
MSFLQSLNGYLLALFVGLVLPLTLRVLPEHWVLLCLLGLGLLLCRIWALGATLAVLLLGFVWACLFHQYSMQQRLDPQLDRQLVWVEGRIQGLPEQTANGWRFLLADAKLAESGAALPQIRAHWFAGEPVMQGEYWRLQVRLRRPRGMSNPGSFDYEAWLYARGIGATASVRAAERIQMAPESGAGQLRSLIRERLLQTLGTTPEHVRLVALVVGDRSVLDRQDWQVLQATGTSHLMVISGLHVGMLAAAVFALVHLIGRLGLLPVSWPRYWLAAPLAIFAAAFYSALAGFAVPTQRALLMVSLVLLARLIYRQPGAWTFWLAALCLVVLLDPAAPLLAGFWLSFMAVGLLIFGMGGRLLQSGLWWRWGRAQWVVFVGLWPWLMLWGMPGSVSAPLVNVLAIPWVSVLVVPAALLGTLLEMLFGFSALLQLAALALQWLFSALEWVAGWRNPHLLAFPGWLNWVLGLLAVVALLSPLARLLWLPALVGLLVLLFPQQPRPEQGQLWVTVLDVGQGLSVLLQTREHSLLYDTGARLPSGFDLGEAVVYPALLNLGTGRLDTMLVSHADNDHAGGAPAIVARMPVGQVLAGQHEALPQELGAEACSPGDSWEWDGVRFEVIYSAPEPAPPNERSCVLRAGVGRASVLLSGDLGIRGEYQMLRQDLAADLLLAPHHGSRTSSSYAFIRAVDPRWVVFSAGHHNAYGHPHPKVVERYRELAVEPVYTSRSGATRFVLDGHQPSYLDWSWRERARRFWHE